MRGSRTQGGSGPRTSTANPTHESARGSRGSRGSRWSRDSSRAPTSLGAALLVDAVGKAGQRAPADTTFDVERGGERREKASSTASILSGSVRVVSSPGTSASSGSSEGSDGHKPRRRVEDTERHRRGAPGPGHSLVWQWPECSERRCECAENTLLLLLLLAAICWWLGSLLERQQDGRNGTRTG